MPATIDLSNRPDLVGDLFQLPKSRDQWEQYKLAKDTPGTSGWSDACLAWLKNRGFVP